MGLSGPYLNSCTLLVQFMRVELVLCSLLYIKGILVITQGCKAISEQGLWIEFIN